MNMDLFHSKLESPNPMNCYYLSLHLQTKCHTNPFLFLLFFWFFSLINYMLTGKKIVSNNNIKENSSGC